MKQPIRFSARSILALTLLTGLAVSSAFAGTTGKLTGRVLDAKGAPLPGVNVVLEGTRKGAVTDPNGVYVILSIDPGEYTATASLIGYHKEHKKGIRVQADFTTTVDFKLTETAVELGELVVQAERPPVEPDKTTSKYVITAKDIEDLPIVRDVSEFVALQAGVSLDGNTIIRGGDLADAAYYVDGIRLVNNDVRGARNFTGMNKSAIQEITVITGGMEAEYGNAQGGIINIVTKDGGDTYRGYLDYRFTPAGKKHWGANVYENPIHKGKARWNDPAWANETYTDPGPDQRSGTADDVTRLAHQRTDYPDQMGHYVEANLSGPLSKNVSFFVTTRYNRQPNPFPGAKQIGFYTDNGSFIPGPFNTQNTFKLTFTPSSNLKVKVGGLYQKQKLYNSGTLGGATGVATSLGSGTVLGASTSAPGAIRGLGEDGKNLFLRPDWSAAGRATVQEWLGYFTLTHSLSPKTFYELRISQSVSKKDTSDIPASTSDVVRDKDKWFNVYRSIVDWEAYNRTRWGVKFDFSSQATKGHFLKAGFDFTRFSTWYTNFEFPSPLIRRVRLVGKDHQVGVPIHPYQGALYIQDKMEFEGLIINAGVRFDFVAPNVNSPILEYTGSPMYSTMTTFRNIPTKKSPVQMQFSPRVGVSHPITASSLFRFSYGLFAQYPEFWSILGEGWQGTKPDDDRNKNGRIDETEKFQNLDNVNTPGTPVGSLKFLKTISFEAGMDWNFVRDYVVAVTTFYKSATNQITTHSYNWNDPKKALKVTWGGGNVGYLDSRGLEFSLRKNLSHNFSFHAAYNVAWASGGSAGETRSDWFPDATFIASGKYWYEYTYDPTTGAEIPKPLTAAEVQTLGAANQTRVNNIIAGEAVRADGSWSIQQSKDVPGIWIWRNIAYGSGNRTPRGVDRRNTGSLQLNFSTPWAFGPKVQGWQPIGDLRVNVIYRIQTGTPWTYQPPVGARRWEHRPITTRFDLNAEKSLLEPKKKLRAVLFLEVKNLFNQQDLSRFENTFDWYQWGVALPRVDSADYKTYGDPWDLVRYGGTPQQIGMGVRLSF